MRLFRQPRLNDWQSVLQRVKLELLNLNKQTQLGSFGKLGIRLIVCAWSPFCKELQVAATALPSPESSFTPAHPEQTAEGHIPVTAI
jgi:hypothetical protein